jgi:hypothetical protein
MLIPTQLGVMKNDKKSNFIQHFMYMIRYFFQNSTNYIKKRGIKLSNKTNDKRKDILAFLTFVLINMPHQEQTYNTNTEQT